MNVKDSTQLRVHFWTCGELSVAAELVAATPSRQREARQRTEDADNIDENSDVLESDSEAIRDMCAAGAACAKYKLADLSDGCLSVKLTNASCPFPQATSWRSFLLQGRTEPQSSE